MIASKGSSNLTASARPRDDTAGEADHDPAEGGLAAKVC